MVSSREQARLNLITAVRLIDKYFALKYDPDQPRDEAGRWSEEGGGSSESSQSGESGGGYAHVHESTFKEGEDRIRDNKKEIGLVYKDGELIVDKTGSKRSVEFTNDEIKKMEGCVMIHNHVEYTGVRIGVDSFSPADIAFMHGAKLSEIRAVAGNTTYIMRNLSPNESSIWFRMQMRSAIQVFDKHDGDYDKVWEHVAKRMNWEYIKIDRKG